MIDTYSQTCYYKKAEFSSQTKIQVFLIIFMDIFSDLFVLPQFLSCYDVKYLGHCLIGFCDSSKKFKKNLLFLQKSDIPPSEKLGLYTYEFNDIPMSEDETLKATIAMFRDADIIKKYRIPYDVGVQRNSLENHENTASSYSCAVHK